MAGQGYCCLWATCCCCSSSASSGRFSVISAARLCVYAGDRARECVCAQMCVFFNRLSSGFHYPINFIRTHRCNITTIEIDQNDAKMHLSLFFYTGLPGVAYLDIVEEQHKDHVKMLAAGCGVTSSLLISPFLHRFVGHHPLPWYLLVFFFASLSPLRPSARKNFVVYFASSFV